MANHRFIFALFQFVLAVVLIPPLAGAIPASVLRARHLKLPSELRDSYDFIVIGGGTAGLTIADRLSESSQSWSHWQGNASDGSANGFTAHQYNITSKPQTELNNKIVSVNVGFCVGGSSAINGMVAIYFVPPDPTLAADFNITYDIQAAWGQDRDNHLYASYPGGLDPKFKTYYNALKSVPNIEFPRDGHAGSHGVFWYPLSVDPKTHMRSYARIAHWDDQERPNYDLITGCKVNKILLDKHNVATGVQFVFKVDNTIYTVKASKEVILSAGTMHTPQLLQLSGIGPAGLLKKANIAVKVDLPGVGSNFQDHPIGPPVVFNWGQAPPTPPTNSTNMPPSEGQGQGLVAFLNLPVAAPDAYGTIAARYQSLDLARYVAPDTAPAVLAGQRAQQAIFAREMRAKRVSFLNYVVFPSPMIHPINFHITSRGTVHINTTAPEAEPVVDYRALTNPTDIDLMIAYIRFFRRFMASGPLAQYGPVEATPGANVSTDAQLASYIRAGYNPQGWHPVGTAAKMRRELGGVVDDELRVYGVRGLRVADASIIPTLVAATTQLTVYTIAEKIAAMIKETWERPHGHG
ncbi:hypothetical protein B0T22DRAFT_510753 [Podospora appendiculata]|uniref:Glucose-methanol-choline oxidoreductase N-terminal domain-containing protein n=1 Tax=Podospora appendiculata TaxID=314037 RepID=A0AAE1CBT5_9PEZI|nr:hypothetical protein B0T22DRAFT_510753 [Podospora appendiculata]